MTESKKKRLAAAKAEKLAQGTPSTRPEAVVETDVFAQESTDPVGGFEAEYLRHEPAARLIAEGDVKTFSGNALIVRRNVSIGVSAVLAERSSIEGDAAAPKVDFARIAAVVGISEGLVFATQQALKAVAAKSELSATMARVYELRGALLVGADALVKAGLLDADEVAKIREDKGPIDAAHDCIALSSLFRRNESKIAGRTAVTAEQLRDAATVGSDALRLLNVDGANPAPRKPDAVARACESRDRTAALLAREYGYVERVAGWLWGRGIGERVPPLQSRTVTRNVGPAKPPAAPPTA